MISEERLSKAMTYLAETDEKAADLLAEMERSEFRAKAIADAYFLHTDGKNIPEREAKARQSEEYREAMEAYFDAVSKFHSVKNKRQTESLVVDVWRSMNANRRQG